MTRVAGRAIVPALFFCWGFFSLAASAYEEEGTPARSHPALLAVVDERGDSLVQLRLAPGDEWCLAWNHSVEGFRVLDCYRYREGRMVLTRSHQPDFAAGLGHFQGRGTQVSDGAGGYWIENIDEPVPGDRYLLRVGSPTVNHRLVYNDNVISLSALAAGERVSIQLHRNEE